MHAFTNDDSVHYAGGGRVGEPRPEPIEYPNFQLRPPVPDAFDSGDRLPPK